MDKLNYNFNNISQSLIKISDENNEWRVDISNDIITLSNHNFQTGQKLLYASVISDASPTGAANTSVDDAFAYGINKRFDDTIWASFDMTIFTFDSN